MTRKMLKPLTLITAVALFGIALGIPQPVAANGTQGTPLFANETVMLDSDSLMLSDLFIGLPAGKGCSRRRCPAPWREHGRPAWYVAKAGSGPQS